MVRVVVPRLAGVCAIAGALIGCGVDEIDHLGDDGGDTSLGSVSATSFFQDDDPTSGVIDFDTNFPDPALIRCGGFGDLARLDGLRSAWGVVALPGSTYAGAPIEAGSIRVRLGEQRLFDCQDAIEPASCGDDGSSSTGTGSSAGCRWGLSFTLAPGEVYAGKYRLEELADPDFELALEEWIPEPESITGELTLVNVTPECLVGALFVTNEVEAVVFDGAFAAELCDRQCLPGPEHDCG